MAKVSIIGTGDFAKALGHRLTTHDYSVLLGSRFPKQRMVTNTQRLSPELQVCDITEAIREAEVVFICIPHDHHHSLKQFSSLFKGKVVVDVSNTKKASKAEISVAEELAQILPDADVVKAFNTLSAYGIENDLAGEGKTVLVSGDNPDAKAVVMQIAKSCGFGAVDFGKLSSARQLEAKTHEFFGKWGPALGITLVVHIVWMILGYLRYYLFREPTYTAERIPTNTMNKIFAVDAITILSFCYLPGSIACFIQLARGTKYSRFPSWLDIWLKARKYLGLLALATGFMHLFMSTVMFNSAYYPDWFLTDSITINITATEHITLTVDSRMSWMGETAILLAACGIFLMTLLGLTSVPAIGNYLNWRQWNFVHTYLGYSCLLLCTAHVTVKGANSWVDSSWEDILPTLTFMSCLIPWLTLFLRLLLWMPCLLIPLSKIRGGWERNANLPAPSRNGTVHPMDDEYSVNHTTSNV